MAGQNNGKQGGQQQDVNQLLKVRREKLANLQEAGQDPFQITKYDVTHHTSDVKELYNAHEEKLLAGRPAVNTDGMDEAAAREAVKADYEERRSIMDADLGRSQAQALGVLQGGGHIVQQVSQLLVKVGDRVANLVQDGVVLL